MLFDQVLRAGQSHQRVNRWWPVRYKPIIGRRWSAAVCHEVEGVGVLALWREKMAEAHGSRTHHGLLGSPTRFCRPDAPPGNDPPPFALDYCRVVST